MMEHTPAQKTPFRPIQLAQANNIYIANQTNNKLHEYHQLLRMKKLLADTEQKMSNRINLFRKSSEKMIKKRDHEFKIVTKIEHIKSHPFFTEKISRDELRSRIQAKTSQGRREREQKKENIQQQSKMTAEKMIQDRIQKAKMIKEEKQRFKIIIEQRKKMDFQRKLKSANSIRQNRNNVKIVKQRFQNERKEEFLRVINQKYERQREQFMELEKHLNELQGEQQRALVDWKRTMDSIM